MGNSALFNWIIGIFSSALLLAVAYIVWQRVKFQRELENRYQTFQSFHRIYQLILEDLDYEAMIQRIADIIPSELRFATGVLAIIDEKKGVLKRVAASQTKQAAEAIKFINTLSIPFEKIEIPVTDQDNIMAKAVREKKRFVTTDVYDVLGPALPKDETKRVQDIMGTKTTFAYPIFIKDNPIAVFIASTKKQQNELSSYDLEVMDSFVNLIGLALEDSKIYTSLKNITGKLEDANKKLHQLDQLKDDFVSVASHELRTPMTAIRSYAWMALHKSDIPLSQNLKRYLYRTLISTERLINLVNDMLNVSRIESGKIEISPKPFDIVALVKEVMEEVKAKADEKRLQIVVMDHQLSLVFADADKVHQVLLNLIGNCLKFSYPGGIITVDFSMDGKMIEVSIKDNGSGVSKEDLSKLFHKFSRLDNSYTSMSVSSGSGTGLGLYISKNLVELMHGKIWVKSEGVDKGSVFTFSLPVANKETMQHVKDFEVKAQGEAKPLESVAI